MRQEASSDRALARLGAAREARGARALVLAATDARTPRLTKLAAVALAAYALSPIDLIPDVIPVLGYLDDLLIVPAGILLVVRLVPPEVMADARQRAWSPEAEHFLGRRGAATIVALWLMLAAVLVAVALRLFR
jgi:uncharacterized membrane protein YkvA (DUF1232 family)